MLDKKIINLLNYRIQQEELSSRIYEQMALWLDNKGFKNFGALYYKYASEEMNHAKWAKDYLLSYGIEPELKALTAPDLDYSTFKQIAELTLQHEQEITKQCNELAKVSNELSCYTCFDLALKYCKEQVEELDKAQTLIDQLNTFGDSKESLLILEHNLA